MSIRRFQRFRNNCKVASYLQSYPVLSLSSTQTDRKLVKDVAMHVAAIETSIFVVRQVPAELIEKERSIASQKQLNLAKASGHRR